MSTLLPRPTAAWIAEAGREFDSDPETQRDENTVRLTWERAPENVRYENVLPKVLVLNNRYSAGVQPADQDKVARHIVKLGTESGLEALLAEGSLSAVERIIQCDGLPQYRSFASKYSSWHNQTAYPIYDSKARECLWKYSQQEDAFRKYSRDNDDYNYLDYARIVSAFRDFYGFTQFTFKQLDKFLYRTGKHLKGEWVFPALAEWMRTGKEPL